MRLFCIFLCLTSLTFTSCGDEAGVVTMQLPQHEDPLEGARWDWFPEQSSLLYSIDQHLSGYDVSITREKGDERGDYTITISDRLGPYAWRTRDLQVFARNGSVLYTTEYNGSRTGCALHAYDLAAKKELWTVQLKGLGPVHHDLYSNRVALDIVEKGRIRIKGAESRGNYLEVVDPTTGETTAHKQFERTEDLPFGAPSLLYCVKRDIVDYDVSITRGKDDPPGHYTINLSDRLGSYAWRTHRGGEFARFGPVLFVTEYSPVQTGCSVRAYDLAAKKEVWNVRLKGLGPVNHGLCHNQVSIHIGENGMIAIQGTESAGSYYEVIDRQTGEMISNKRY